MKKLLIGLSLSVATLLAADWQIGAGFGRNAVKSDYMNSYNYGNLRIGKYLNANNMLRLDLEKSNSLRVDRFPDANSLKRGILQLEHDFDYTISDLMITPYAYIGAGYQSVKGVYKNGAVGDLGLGLKANISHLWDVFLEARGMQDFENSDTHYGILGGVDYIFPTSASRAPAAKTVTNDSDGDGVPNSLDKCPNTPHNVAVDSNGCPLDNDRDGVPNYLDKCPFTPVGVKVDKNGCAVDSDGDGVPNYLDKCPNTPKGFKVDKNGCASAFNFEIHFDYRSAKIKPEYMPAIMRFAEYLETHPNVKAIIEGHTDSKGNYEYNMRLSEKRAKAVYDALVRLGVPRSRLSYVGYGPNYPIAPNDTPQGRAMNRRVVAKIIK